MDHRCTKMLTLNMKLRQNIRPEKLLLGMKFKHFCITVKFSKI